MKLFLTHQRLHSLIKSTVVYVNFFKSVIFKDSGVLGLDFFCLFLISLLQPKIFHLQNKQDCFTISIFFTVEKLYRTRI